MSPGRRTGVTGAGNRPAARARRGASQARAALPRRRRWVLAALLVAIAGGVLIGALLARSPDARPAGAGAGAGGSAASSGPVAPVAPVAPAVPAASAARGGPGALAAPVAQAAPAAVERLKVKVVSVRPHDPTAYTQGLVWDRGTLYESAGLYRRSSLRQVDLRTGEVLRHVDVPPAYFAEGLALVDNHLVQLTWKEGVAFVYDALSFGRVGELHYDGEGWGLCDDGRRLVMSDGSDRLGFRDRRTFALLGGVDVRLDGRPVQQLNELECVGGAVYANVWMSDEIVRIDPASGQVSAVIDASGLLDAAERAHADVLNGIAYDAAKKTFLLTGKLWPKLFEVVFVAAGAGAQASR